LDGYEKEDKHSKWDAFDTTYRKLMETENRIAAKGRGAGGKKWRIVPQ
jgi:hypothetical protein